jgi:Ca2+-binding EF-hand superfamily protein
MPNSTATVELLMKELDPDQSGTLDWTEFQMLAKKVHLI